MRTQRTSFDAALGRRDDDAVVTSSSLTSFRTRSPDDDFRSTSVSGGCGRRKLVPGRRESRRRRRSAQRPVGADPSRRLADDYSSGLSGAAAGCRYRNWPVIGRRRTYSYALLFQPQYHTSDTAAAAGCQSANTDNSSAELLYAEF